MSTAIPYDLVIRGGTVIDGTKAPRFEADVGVRDGRIAAVGDLAGASAARTIDAAGLIVAPGFIDSHTHDDQALLSHPGMGLQGLAGRDDGDRRQLRHQRRTAGEGHAAAVAARPDRGSRLRAPRDLRLVGAGARGRAGGDQRRRARRPLDAARRGDGRPRPRPTPEEIARMQALLVEALEPARSASRPARSIRPR